MPSVMFGIVLLAVVLTVAGAAIRDARLAAPIENRKSKERTIWDGLPRDSE